MRAATVSSRRFRRAALLAAVLASACGVAQAAPELDYRGTVLPRRSVERLAERALAHPADTTELSRFLGEVVTRLQNLGHLEARAIASWEEARRLRVDVAEGPRARLSRVELFASTPAESLLVASALGIAAGAWASPGAVGEAIDRGVAQLVSEGHAYAALGVARWERDSTGAVDLGLNVAPGPRVTVTELRYDGARVTRRDLLDRATGRLDGTTFRPASVEEARARLQQLGLFRSVDFVGIESDGDASRARLVYRVEEPRYHRFEGAVGYQGDAGPVGLARLGLDNLLGTGRAVGLDWESRGRGVSQLGARYAEPLLFGSPIRFELAFEHRVQDTLFVRTRWGAKGRFALSGTEWIEGGYEEERVVQTRQSVRHARTQMTRFGLEHDGRDQPAGPRDGMRLRIEATQRWKREDLRPTGSLEERASDASLLGEWHRRLTRRSTLAVEGSAIARFSAERVIPLYDRFTLGGASSLRGYDEEAFRVDRYALSRLEWRWYPGAGAARIFTFWDHAEAATRELLPSGEAPWRRLRLDGVGFGFRVETPGGLVGLDYGVPPGRPPLEGKVHLRLVSAF